MQIAKRALHQYLIPDKSIKVIIGKFGSEFSLK